MMLPAWMPLDQREVKVCEFTSGLKLEEASAWRNHLVPVEVQFHQLPRDKFIRPAISPKLTNDEVFPPKYRRALP